MAIPKDFLWSTVAQLTDELERVDPQSLMAARMRGFLAARDMALHTTDRHRKNGAGAGQDDLIASLYLNGKSAYTIAAEIGRGVPFVTNALKRRDIKIRTPRAAQRATAVQRGAGRLDRIRALRAEGKTLEEIGAELHITRERVRQLCVKNGISPERCLTPEQKQAVAEYVAGESLQQVAVRHQTSPTTLRGWITKDGFAIRPSPRTSKRDPETLKRAAKAAELYHSGQTVAEISRACGYGESGGAPVYRLLAIAGVKPDRGSFNCNKQELTDAAA